MVKKLVAALCGVALLTSPIAGKSRVPVGRAYSVEDLLGLEDVGQVMFARSAGLVLIERFGPYAARSDYSTGPWGRRQTSTIMAMPLQGDAALKPLFTQDANCGYWIASLSPSRRRLAVFRLGGRQLDLGIVDLEDRSVRWLPVAPDLPLLQHGPQWLDDDHLAVISFPVRRLPYVFSATAEGDDQSALWRAQAVGKVPSDISVTSKSPTPRPSNMRTVELVDVRSLSRRPLFRGNVVDMTAAGGRLAVLSITGSVPVPRDKLLTTDFNANRFALDVMSTEPGAATQRVADDVMPGVLAWNASGSALLYATRDRGEALWTKPRLEVAHLTSGNVRRDAVPLNLLVRPGWSNSSVHARWAGDGILAEAGASQGSARWVFLSGRDGPPIFIGPQNAELVRANGNSATFFAAHVLTTVGLRDHAPDVVTHNVEGFGKGPEGTYLGSRALLNPPTADTPVAIRKGTAFGASVLLSNGTLSVPLRMPARSVLRAAEPGYAVVSKATDRGETAIFLVAANRRPRLMAEINRHLAGIAEPSVVELSSTMSDGSRQKHWLFLPTKLGRSQPPPPLTVIVYPGSAHAERPVLGEMRARFESNENISVLVGHGYAVLQVGLPFARDRADPLGDLTSDVGTAVDAAVATGRVNGRRVALLGHSFGGYGVLAIASRTNRYQAVVAENAPIDMTAAYGSIAGPDRIRLELGLPIQQAISWAETGQGDMGAPPWIKPQAYIAASLTYSLDRVSTPLLLVSGDQDFVGMDGVERAFLSLIRLGNDVELVRYWGEGHLLISPANIGHYYSRLFTFVDRRFDRSSSQVSNTVPNVGGSAGGRLKTMNEATPHN